LKALDFRINVTIKDGKSCKIELGIAGEMFHTNYDTKSKKSNL
jgi:hypothetical protein